MCNPMSLQTKQILASTKRITQGRRWNQLRPAFLRSHWCSNVSLCFPLGFAAHLWELFPFMRSQWLSALGNQKFDQLVRLTLILPLLSSVFHYCPKPQVLFNFFGASAMIEDHHVFPKPWVLFNHFGAAAMIEDHRVSYVGTKSLLIYQANCAKTSTSLNTINLVHKNSVFLRNLN